MLFSNCTLEYSNWQHLEKKISCDDSSCCFKLFHSFLFISVLPAASQSSLSCWLTLRIQSDMDVLIDETLDFSSCSLSECVNSPYDFFFSVSSITITLLRSKDFTVPVIVFFLVKLRNFARVKTQGIFLYYTQLDEFVTYPIDIK